MKPSKNAKDYIIFALDVPTPELAGPYIDALSGHVGLFKVGLELFINAGHKIIRSIHDAGDTQIFLDLKLHDIPATVGRAMGRIADLGIRFATVHCGENPEMLAAAVAAANGNVGVLGVTVLTSVSETHIRDAGYDEKWVTDMPGLVVKRAREARTAGCAGVICSGLEAGIIKTDIGTDFTAVTPGIRPAWESVDAGDQQRIMTPARAIQNGSDYLVIGRPIRDAKDPREAAIRIAEEIDAVL